MPEPAVIASRAKQSISPCGQNGLLVAISLRNDDSASSHPALAQAPACLLAHLLADSARWDRTILLADVEAVEDVEMIQDRVLVARHREGGGPKEDGGCLPLHSLAALERRAGFMVTFGKRRPGATAALQLALKQE